MVQWLKTTLAKPQISVPSATTLNADSWIAVPAGHHNAVWQNVIQAGKSVQLVEEARSHNLPPVISKVQGHQLMLPLSNMRLHF